MIRDRFGSIHGTASLDAVSAFEEAVHGVAAHRPSAAEALGRALSADPSMVAAHALRGFANVMLARDELLPIARGAHSAAVLASTEGGGVTASERALTDALGYAVAGRLHAAADRLDRHLDASPREFLHAKIAHSLRFMAGDLEGMLLGTARLIDAWTEDAPGYGFLLGCHAFALEEKGEFDAAERVGRRAVELAPDDAWGLHAVSHVYEMQGRVDEGIAWIKAKRPVWTACNNFSFHMAWHLALFHLERGEHELVLALYDTEVRPRSTDDFRDMSNAVSLLWRLEQDGVAVGDRWDEVRAIASRRRSDMTLTFACLHNLLALVATGRRDDALDLVTAMSERARNAAPTGMPRGMGSDQASVMNDIGRDLGRVVLALCAGSERSPVEYGQLANKLTRIGGSHAQRDVFLRTLAALAADRRDRIGLEQVLTVRRGIKRDDRFEAQLQARIAGRRESSRASI